MRATPDNWWLAEPGGKPTGPWTTEQVLQKIRSGEVRQNFLCWREGMQTWVSLLKVEAFRHQFGSGASGRSEDAPGSISPRMGGTPKSIRGGHSAPRFIGEVVSETRSQCESTTTTGKPKRRWHVWLLGAAGISVGAIVLAVAFHTIFRPGDSSKQPTTEAPPDEPLSKFAKIVRDYVDGLKKLTNSGVTKAQEGVMREKLRERLESELRNCGEITMEGKVREIEEARDGWAIFVDGPTELLGKEGLSAEIVLITKLDRPQVLKVSRGDPVQIKARVVYSVDPDLWELAPVMGPSHILIAFPLDPGKPSPPPRNLRSLSFSDYFDEWFALVLEEGATCNLGGLSGVPVSGVRIPLGQDQKDQQKDTKFAGPVPDSEISEPPRPNPDDPRVKERLAQVETELAQARSTQVKAFLLKSEGLIAQGKYDDAVLTFATLIQTDLSSRVLSPKFSDHLIEMELARASRLTEQGNYTEAAAVIAKLLQPDPYSTDHYSDVRMALTKQFLSRAESLINEEKFSEASTPLEKARQLDTSHSWIDDFLGDLHEVSRMAKLHSEMEVALRGNDLSRAWELVRTLSNITRAFRFKSEEEVNRHFPQAVSVLKRSIERFQKECTERLTEIASQLVEKNLAEVEKLNPELRAERAEANRLLQEVFAVEAELPQAEELHEKLARARELQQKIAELEKAQEPDLTGTWRETSSAPSFWPRPEVEIRDDGLLVSVQLKKREETFGFGPRMKVESFSANLNRSRDNPRQLAGSFAAEFEGRSSKFSGRMTITIPENETDRIQVRFSDWPRFDSSGRVIPNPTPQPLHVTWERVKEQEWGPGLLMPGAVRPFP